jgi:sn-glycerol 3-phosphate transport system substrate-binding protein
MRLQWVFILVLTALIGVGSALPAWAGEPITATFWYSYGGKVRQVTEDMVKKFNSSQTKYRIDGSFQGDYFQALAKIRAAITTKTAPTIFHVIGEAMPDLWQGGMFENLEPYVKSTGVKTEEFVQALSQHGYFDYYGKSVPLFAIPFNRSMPVMYYNKDMLDAKGVKVPTSWDELRDAAAKLTVREGNDVKTWGFEVPVDWWFWHGLLYQAGGSLLSADGKQAAFRQKGGEALQYWVDMVNKHKIMKRPGGKDYNAWEVTNTDFITQKAAMIFTSTAFVNYLTENVKFKMGTAFLPKKEKFAAPTGGTFFVMIKDATPAQKQAGWAFIKWMSDPAQAIYWSQNTGYICTSEPAIKSAEMQKFYQDNPNYRVAYEQLKYAQRMPFTPALIRIQREAIQPNLEAPVIGLKTVDETMAAAEKVANDILAGK